MTAQVAEPIQDRQGPVLGILAGKSRVKVARPLTTRQGPILLLTKANSGGLDGVGCGPLESTAHYWERLARERLADDS
jgi:hypothetical protein